MILVLLFNLAYILLLIVFAWSAQKVTKAPEVKVPEPVLVSLIVPVRNEARQLTALLQSLKNQDYPSIHTEWIFVDDHSEDETYALLSQENDRRLKILRLPSGKTGKKAALTMGIQAAQGSMVITTDADCIPMPEWISTLIAVAEQTQAIMVCGAVQISERGDLMSAFQAMETGVLQISGAGSLNTGHPLLNTGTSLCFRKSAWENVNGYSDTEQIASGDDTFLMLKFQQKYPGRVIPCLYKAAIVSTAPAGNWKEILQQRIRWNGKVKHYPPGSIHMTGIIVLLSGLLWMFLPLFPGKPERLLPVFFFIFIGRVIAEAAVLAVWKKATSQSFSPVSILLMSVFYPVFTLFSFIIRPFMKTAWKGRRV
ncbi:MAG: glycosyltransferase [Bacteroidia bacterium]